MPGRLLRRLWARTKDYYRFDPLLHARFDSLQKGCREGKLIMPEHEHGSCDHLFHCGAGNGSFSLGYDGTFRLCSSLWHPAAVVSVRPGAPGAMRLREA